MERDQHERCRELIAALILHGNVAIRAQSNVLELRDGIRLKHQHWQIFEYIVEHRDRGFSMAEISYNLSIPPSTFSKTVKLLCGYGLVEKHQLENNRKNIFLRPTERGLQLYDEVTPAHVLPDLQHFFDLLETVSDDDLRCFVRAIKALDDMILPERQKEEALLTQQR
jgi:DNA-binding MarR family transcriptional regulator